jgi:methyl-accepting chemotaxis protein
LAFNASIEAARAGVHGRGFSIIAEEVQKLAVMSGKAANEINGLLDTSASRVGEFFSGTSERIRTGQAATSRCQDSFGSMNNILPTIVAQMQSIDGAANQQAIGVKEVNHAMADLDRTTHENSQNAESLARYSKQIVSLVDEVSTSVAKMNEVFQSKGAA